MVKALDLSIVRVGSNPTPGIILPSILNTVVKLHFSTYLLLNVRYTY